MGSKQPGVQELRSFGKNNPNDTEANANGN